MLIAHLSLQHVLLLEIGLHVCRHPKMPIFYSGQVCDEKEQSKLAKKARVKLLCAYLQEEIDINTDYLKPR